MNNFNLGGDKKGQEFSITTLLILVLGIIVLVIVVVGFTYGWNFIFGKIGLLPGQDLQAVAKSCEIAAEQDLKIDYCSQFKAVTLPGSSGKTYINCEYPGLELTKKLGSDCGNDEAKKFCNNIAPEKRADTKIYDKNDLRDCATLTAEVPAD